MDLSGLDFVSLTAGYGLPGHRGTNQNDFADSLRATISSGAPSLLDVKSNLPTAECSKSE